MLPSFLLSTPRSTHFLSLALGVAALTHAHPPELHEVFSHDVKTEAKPWTHLEFQNDPDNFQFAIVTDRTGGIRPGVFEDAVKKLNWMMPEFVLTVGDLIQGSTATPEANSAEWDGFMEMVEPLKMPFFFLAGNHDIQTRSNPRPDRVSHEAMLAEWNARFGTTHYSFIYKGVLFITLFTNEGEPQVIGEGQVEYFRETLAEFQDVRWTFLLMHHPLWLYGHESNFDAIEKALLEDGRRHTVIAGHRHRYTYYERNNEDYIVLASTGGGSGLRGPAFGEFDQFAWFTMTDEGPIMANLDLAGIYAKDVTRGETIDQLRGLHQSGDVETSLLLDTDDNGMVQGASVYLAMENHAEEPLRFSTRFGHSHHLDPSIGELVRELPPGATEVVEVEFEVLKPFSVDDGMAVDLHTEARPVEAVSDEIQLSDSRPLVFAASEADVFLTESVEFIDQTEFGEPHAGDQRAIHYTLDGGEPTAASPRLDAPLMIDDATALRARVVSNNGIMGPVDEVKFSTRSAGQGLWARYYEHPREKGKIAFMPNLLHMEPTYVQHVSTFTAEDVARVEQNFIVVFHGWLTVEEAGNYGFHVLNEDGARLFLKGEMIVDDMILHARRETTGFARLEAGRHPIELHFCQTSSGYRLGVEMTGPDGVRGPIPLEALSIDADSIPTWEVTGKPTPMAR